MFGWLIERTAVNNKFFWRPIIIITFWKIKYVDGFLSDKNSKHRLGTAADIKK